ncbi:MAG: CoA pyrophosphatase [Bacteroidota bacterium]
MKHLLDFLEQRTNRPLPHEDQNLPSHIRDFRDGVSTPDRPPRVCAVMMSFFEDEGKIALPFMQRPDDGSVHGGQISFPGGGIEEADNDLFDTAIREAEEEIGIQVARSSIIGTLSEIYIPPSNSLGTPVLASLPSRPESYTPDPNEVARVLEVAISDLRNPSNHTEKSVTLSDGRKMRFPAFGIDNYLIWGATARILSELFLLLEELD